jgi:hypothetical protein
VQLHQPDILDAIAAMDARLIVVSFAPLAEFQEWVPYFRERFLERFYKDNNLEMRPDIFARTRFVADPDLEAYHSYGLGRLSPWAAYGLKITWHYMRFIAQGKPLRIPKQSTLQRGGDFVISRDGKITLSLIGKDQSERPSINDVLAALRM